jgi:hypothetical protein
MQRPVTRQYGRSGVSFLGLGLGSLARDGRGRRSGGGLAAWAVRARFGRAYHPLMRISRFVVMTTLSVVATLVSSGAALAAPRSGGATGYDVSYPQCSGGALPARPAFGIVGVSDGLAYGKNTCLAQQYAWALTAPAGAPAPAFYMNTGNPGTGATRVNWYAPAGPNQCDSTHEDGCAYNYGYNAARDAFSYATNQSSLTAATTAAWWLDVETANSWVGSASQNVIDIQGSIAFLTSKGIQVGIYSTGYQWGQITGGAQLPTTVLNWVAGALNKKGAPALCSPTFSGGNVKFVQYPSGGFDADYVC